MQLQRQIDELKAANAESQRTAQFWQEKASQAPAPAAPAKPAAEEPEVDVLELATKGGNAFKAWLNQWAADNGFVKGDQMTAAMNAKAAELSKQGELIARYPDLKNGGSDFFKATAVEYGNLKKQGVGEVLAMEMAAEKVELRFLREGKTKTPAQTAADAEADKLQRRRERAAAGSGDRGGRAAAPPEGEGDDELTEDQRNIAIRLLVDDETTPEQAVEKYKARAKKGVAMKGVR